MRFTSPGVTTIAQFTIRGYVKDRVLSVVLMFGFVLMVSSYVLSPMAVGAQSKIIVDLGLAAVSLFGVILVILLGASSYSREKEKGILPSILAKPISRTDFVLGKYLGTVATICSVALLMALVYFGVMLLSNTAFHKLIFVAIYLTLLEIALLTSVMTLFSAFTTPLLASFFTACVFVAGHLGKDLFAFSEHVGGSLFRFIASVAFYVLPNFSLFNIRPEAVHNLPLLDNYIPTVTVYGIFYSATLLFFSALLMSRRDIK